MHVDQPGRLDDLLLARATEGLSADDERELERLLAAHPGVDEGAYDRAAAAVCLAVLSSPRGMPSSLRARLEQRAVEFTSTASNKD